VSVIMRRNLWGIVLCLGLGSAFGAAAANETAYPGTVIIPTTQSYAQLLASLKRAVKTNGMGLVAQASATRGARSIGVTIPGNAVVMVFHPKFAVRMLEASVPAGIEDPIRYYVTENTDGTATLRYRTPSSLFGPYHNADLDIMAHELDRIFEKIASDAAGG